jgi:hypothetical protein
MHEKVELASPEWMRLFGELLRRHVATAGEDFGRFSICEVYLDPPPHLAPGAGQIAWHCYIRGRDVEFGVGEIADADLTISGDYSFIRELARWVHRPETDEAFEALRLSGVEAGKLTTRGDRSRAFILRPLHNEIAELTL